MTSILLSPADTQSGLTGRLENLGARVIEWPELQLDVAESCFALDEAIENLFGYDWLILRNEAAATYFLKRFQLKHELDELDDLKILSIGDKTSQALAQSQIHVDVPIDRSANLFKALESYVGDFTGVNVLVPSANLYREAFEQQLEDAGARVDKVTAYRTVSDNQRLTQLKALLVGGGIDCILFTSLQFVDEFIHLVDTDDLREILAGLMVACGDSQTAAAAMDLGLGDQVVSADLTTTGLASLVNAVFPRPS
jgi:uroporphyrinogen-III synthase